VGDKTKESEQNGSIGGRREIYTHFDGETGRKETTWKTYVEMRG
jgi:hypothetical protein